MGDYQIKQGDNLWKIVRDELNIKNNSEIQKKVIEIAELNNIKNINSIFVGQYIKLYAETEQQEKKEKLPATLPDRSPCFVFKYEQPQDSFYPGVYLRILQKCSSSSPFLQTVPAALTPHPKAHDSIKQEATLKPVERKKVVNGNLHNFDIRTKFEGTAEEIDKHLGGVLKGHGAKFLELQDKYGINAVFLAAITMNESENGTTYSARKRNNVGGIRYRQSYKFRVYNNVDECLEDMASLLKRRYINMGRTTVAKVGAKYCPIADKSDKEGINKYWARNVSYYMKRIINDTA